MNNNFSPNMIKTYLTCPKKYYYQYVENVAMPKSSLPFEKGKKIHALANYYLQNIKIDRIETALTGAELEIWELLKQNPFYNMNYLKSEFSLMLKLSDFWLGGRLDALVNNGDNYYILDYKTGTIPKDPEYDPQTMIYLLCADKYLKNYKTLSFVYIDLKNKQNYVIEFNEDLKAKYRQNLLEICNKISADSLYCCNDKSCKYCEFNKICIK